MLFQKSATSCFSFRSSVVIGRYRSGLCPQHTRVNLSFENSRILHPLLSRSQRQFSSQYSRLLLASDKKTTAEKLSRKSKQRRGQEGFRADRVLSNRGWASRSECFELLKQKRVYWKTKDAAMKRILGPSEKIPMDASLWVDGTVEVPLPPPLLRVYHKPKWMLSVMNDSHGRRHLGDLDFISNMHPVGRLDYDTSGLLLFSSNGSLTQTLLHPSHEIEKEYLAIVTGNVDEPSLRVKLAQGVTTSMGDFPATLLETKIIPQDQVASIIANILGNLPPEYDLEKLEEKGYLSFKSASELSHVRLTVQEGKHRMVRRILANVGHPVISLKRERLGAISLGEMEAGAFRDLTPDEEAWAQGLLKVKSLINNEG